MKTVVTVSRNNVTVARDNPFTGDRETTTYFCPHDGGYVRIRDSAGQYPQVCERLSSTGSTLHISSAERLPAVIRREMRRRAALEREAGKLLD